MLLLERGRPEKRPSNARAKTTVLALPAQAVPHCHRLRAYFRLNRGYRFSLERLHPQIRLAFHRHRHPEKQRHFQL